MVSYSKNVYKKFLVRDSVSSKRLRQVLRLDWNWRSRFGDFWIFRRIKRIGGFRSASGNFRKLDKKRPLVPQRWSDSEGLNFKNLERLIQAQNYKILNIKLYRIFSILQFLCFLESLLHFFSNLRQNNEWFL